MLRDWVNWCWLSGDHIVEQHVHNIDVCNWFTGAFPIKAVGYGARMRRVTGDQYDFFAVDYVYDKAANLEDGCHMSSYCRQIDGCAGSVSEYVLGTEGSTNCKDSIFDKEGKLVWQYQEPDKEPGKSAFNPYEQEHVDLVNAIRTGNLINEAETTAKTTLTAIMGRIAAYTGKEVTWEQMMSSDLKLGPKEVTMGPIPFQAVVPIPGTEKKGAKPAAG